MDELKPCPFCGKEPKIVHYYISGTANRLNYFAECGCGARIRNRRQPEGTQGEWNTRPLEDALCAEVARLTAELDSMTKYADKLAQGLPEGMLPKDIELMRDANWKMTAENERLKDRLNDYQNDYEKVINDKCPTDERHCGCVQILRKAINNYQNALVLIATFPSSRMQTFAEREMQRAACDVLEDDVGQKVDACKYWVEKVDYLQTELNHRNTVITSLEAELTEARDIILRFLHDPGGCRFCDYGILRKPGVPGKDHDEDCLYVCVHAYLNKNISLDAKRDLSDAEIEEFGASEAESRVDE